MITFVVRRCFETHLGRKWQNRSVATGPSGYRAKKDVEMLRLVWKEVIAVTAAILKNGNKFVFRTNLQWPYISKYVRSYTLYHRVHSSVKMLEIPLPVYMLTCHLLAYADKLTTHVLQITYHTHLQTFTANLLVATQNILVLNIFWCLGPFNNVTRKY